MKENGPIIKDMGMEILHSKMEMSIRGIGNKIIEMDKEKSLLLMEKHMMENGLIIKEMDMELKFMPQEKSTKGYGNKTEDMENVKLLIKMEINSREYIATIKKNMEFKNMPMMINMKDNF